jgi:D-alanyl-D-alanine carboxypeptidase
MTRTPDDSALPLSRRSLLSRSLAAAAGLAAAGVHDVAAIPGAAGIGGQAMAAPAIAPLPEWPLARLRALARRLEAVQGVIGHGRFNLVSFDDVRAAAPRTAAGALTAAETAEFEALLALDARRIGFLGKRVVTQLSYRLPANLVDVGRGQHVFAEANALFVRARAAVGEQLIVTSGARGIPKQMLVFIGSALRAGLVARRVHSVAPPGYSYHAVGDIDVGDRRLGGTNFTEAFAQSETYRKLAALPYIRFRYPPGNPFGVQFEPWHLEVART